MGGRKQSECPAENSRNPHSKNSRVNVVNPVDIIRISNDVNAYKPANVKGFNQDPSALHEVWVGLKLHHTGRTAEMLAFEDLIDSDDVDSFVANARGIDERATRNELFIKPFIGRPNLCDIFSKFLR
jgi:hypothetical protein